jgi:nucleotide-binding universal stress UspA family protein
MFTRIVVGIDGAAGGRDALSLARTLAAGNADIVLLSTLPYPGTASLASVAFAEPLRADVQAMLDEAAGEDRRCRTRLVEGWSAGRALHEAAVEVNAELIVIGSAHRGAVGRVLLGDVSRATLHNAPCPVAVAPGGLREGAPDRLARIGVGVKGSAESDAALAVAARLAAEAGATVHLLTAVPTPTAVMPAYASCYDWAEIDAANREAAQQAIAAAAARLDVPVRTEIADGGAGAALEELSGRVDLLVAGSRGWGAAHRVVLGSTTDRLTHHARCPVLVVPVPKPGDRPSGC